MMHKPTYKLNGILVGLMLTFVVPQFAHATTNTLLIKNNFRMSFVLLVHAATDANTARIATLNQIKADFANVFHEATQHLATMDTSLPVTVIVATPNMFDSFGGLNAQEVTRKYFASHPDNAEFIAIFDVHNPEDGNDSYYPVKNDVIGITKGNVTFDGMSWFGGSGVLEGVLRLGPIDNSYDTAEHKTMLMTGLLHETGHRWCCYVGDTFTRSNSSSKLEILEDGWHFYPGLACPFSDGCELGSSYWTPNGDGTFTRYWTPNGDGTFTRYWTPNGDGTFTRLSSINQYPSAAKYHPFTLYAMGLLPESEYDTKYQIYDLGVPANINNGSEKINDTKAKPYGQGVSVRDIISVAGARRVVAVDTTPAVTISGSDGAQMKSGDSVGITVKNILFDPTISVTMSIDGIDSYRKTIVVLSPASTPSFILDPATIQTASGIGLVNGKMYTIRASAQVHQSALVTATRTFVYAGPTLASLANVPSVDSFTAQGGAGADYLSAMMSATLLNFPSCIASVWTFGDGMTESATPSCPEDAAWVDRGGVVQHRDNNQVIPTQTVTKKHTYAAPGTYTITYSIGNVSTSTTVTIMPPIPILRSNTRTRTQKLTADDIQKMIDALRARVDSELQTVSAVESR